MNKKDKVAVCSRSFSRNSTLRKELLARYRNVKFNEKGVSLENEQLVKFLRHHNKAIIGLETLDEYVLSSLPELEVVGKYGVGLDKINLSAMRHHKKKLGWTSGVNKRSVSELALSFMIMMLRKLPQANKEIANGRWSQKVGRQLTNSVVGIIGCGNVGKDLVKMLQPFECKILVHDLVDYSDFYKEYNVQKVALNMLLERSEIVSVHLPLTKDTENILDRKRLRFMKKDAILINTARGGLVDEIFLKKMLKGKMLAGAAFDVFSSEPNVDKELLNLNNFFATPHIGGSSEEAIISMGLAAIKGLDENSIPDI